MLNSEHVCLILLLLLKSQKAKTLAIFGLAAMIMYVKTTGEFQNLSCVLKLTFFNIIIIVVALFSNDISV